MIPIHAPPFLRLAEELPVGGAITGAREALGVDERFEEERSRPVGRLPVVGQAHTRG